MGKPFVVRSALVGVRHFGFVEPTVGGKLVLSDRPDFCEDLRVWREADARGEPRPLVTESSQLLLFFSGTRLERGALRAGTYAVNAGAGGGYTQLPLEVLGGLIRTTADELGGSPTVAGKVELDEMVPLREGAEVSGRLSLMLDVGQPEALEGEFTATFCKYL